MRSRPPRTLLAVVAAVSLAGSLAGCSDLPEPQVVRPAEVETTEPAYDPGLEPSAAVLAVVPADATVLEVTDLEQVRYSLGYGELSSESDPGELDRFWRQAERESPLLRAGMLRDQGYAARFGFTQDDVSWEAHFSGPSGEGYVLKFRDDLDMGRVQRAAEAPDGPLAGATVVPAAQIAALGATREPTESWAAEPALVELAGATAGATYLSRSCAPPEDALAGSAELSTLDDLAELGPFSVAFGGRLVTVRLGPQRTDTFERARLTEDLPGLDPDFLRGFSDPVVADPTSGRIGYDLGDGPLASRLTQEQRLPFAVCV